MKIKHHSIINDLDTEDIDWEKLRDNPNENSILKLKQIIKDNKIDKILFLGCERASLEYHLFKATNVKIDVSDLSDSILRTKNYQNNHFLYNDSIQ